MPIVPANAPLSTAPFSKSSYPDYEPSDEWKLQLRKNIEEGLQSMVADAKESQAAELRKAPDTSETRLRIETSYKHTMQTIKGLATEQYELELNRERNQRRWTAGVPMNAGWTQYFREEQQNIMNSIKQSTNQPPGGSTSADPHMARSPSGPSPEVWKPPAEDPFPPKTYNLGRRASTTSMRSTGSSASIRPSITISGRAASDHASDESAVKENNYPELGRTWTVTDKLHEKEKRPRPYPVDAGLRSDEPLGSSGSRSTNSPTATSPLSNGSLSAKPPLIFVNDDRHYPSNISGEPPYRDQTLLRDGYPLRDHQVPSQDQPSARPISVRSSYVGDDRDYGFSYSTTLHGPHGSKSSYHPQPESRSISRQASQPYVEIDDDDDERDMDRERDRERHCDRDYDKDHDGGRDMYSEPRPSPSARPHSLYRNPPPGGSKPTPQDYIHMNDSYDGRLEGSAGGLNRGRYNYQSLPPDDWEYQRPPDGARPTFSRQPSYVRQRDDPDRRLVGESDDYYRHYAPAGGNPRHPPSVEEPSVHWREWTAEGSRLPNYDYHQQARPPSNGSLSHRRSMHPRPSLYHNSPNEDYPNFGGRETDLCRGNSTVADEYDSEDDGSSNYGIEAKRVDLEARKQRLEEERREADNALKRTELEIQRLASEEEKQNEEERKKNEARRKEEDVRKKEEEVRKKEEEVKRKEEAATKREEEVKKKEEAAKKEDVRRMVEEQAKKKEEELKRKEEAAKKEEVRRMVEEAKKMEEAIKQRESEIRRKAEELRRKEGETKQRAAQLEEDAARIKQLQLAAQKVADDALKKQEDLKKMEEEARKKDMEMKKREDILRRRERELMRRETDNFRREEEAHRKEEANHRSSASTSTGKPRTGSASPGTHPTSSSPHTADADRSRKHHQEQFQEKVEPERPLKSAGRPLSELHRVFEHHERLWNRLNTHSELSWNDFPWPMAKPPLTPDDISLLLIDAYMQSSVYPDKSKTPKDRIKEHIKKWHPDRFETKLLPKVVEDEREKVKEGAGNVARYLSDLLRKENESIFSD